MPRASRRGVFKVTVVDLGRIFLREKPNSYYYFREDIILASFFNATIAE
jgi:hypothetical protein